MEKKSTFEYGYDVNTYIDMAIERIKKEYHYHWADRSMINQQYRYEIEQEDGEYHYVRYVKFAADDIERELLDVNPPNNWQYCGSGEDFIKRIAIDNHHGVFLANKKVDNYKVSFKNGLEVDGWYIERYEFNKHQSGDYSAFVQAGDRLTGGSRDFFIPPEFMSGTYEEFLDKYCQLVPGDKFGLYKQDLLKDNGLKKFLGY